jgi:predicted DNA-binding transcriptional regulator AlpA
MQIAFRKELSDQTHDRLLNVREVARQLGISSRQVFKLRSTGRLPVSISLGRSTRWRASDLAEFIARGCTPEARRGGT